MPVLKFFDDMRRIPTMIISTIIGAWEPDDISDDDDVFVMVCVIIVCNMKLLGNDDLSL